MTTDLTNKFDIISKQLDLSSLFAMNNDTCLLVRLCTVVAGNALVSEMNKVKDLALNGIVSQKFLVDEFQDDVADMEEQNVSIYEELRKRYTEINDITSKICNCTDALIDDVKLIKNLPHLLPSMKDLTQDIESEIKSRTAKVDCDSIGDSAINNLTGAKANLLPLVALDQFKPDGCCSPNLHISKENIFAIENIENIIKSPTEPLRLDDIVRSETTVFHLQIENKPTDNISKEKCRAQMSFSSTTQVAEPPILLLHETPKLISDVLARTSSSFETVSLQNYSIPLEEYEYNSIGKKDNKAGSNIDAITEACLKIFTDDEDVPDIQNKTSSLLLPIPAENKLSRSRTACSSSVNGDVHKESKVVSLLSKSSKHNSADVTITSSESKKVTLADKIVQSELDTNTGKKMSKKMVANVRKRTYTVNKKFNSLPRKVQTIAKPPQQNELTQKTQFTPNKRTFPKNPMPDATRFQPKNKKCRLEMQHNQISQEDHRLAALPLHPSCYKPFVEIQKETVSTTCSDIELYSKTVSVLAISSNEVIKTDIGTDPINEIESDFGTTSKKFDSNVSQNLVSRGTDCCLLDSHQPTKIYVDTCTDPCKSAIIQDTILKPRLKTLGTQTFFSEENIDRKPEHKVRDVKQVTQKIHKHKVEPIVLPKPMLPNRDPFVQKDTPKCCSTDLTADGQFRVIKYPVVYEKSRKTERVIVKDASSAPNEFAEIRSSVTSAAMQKLIAEAMTDSVDFTDRDQFIEFRKKVINAKNGKSTDSPRIHVFRWLDPKQKAEQGSQSNPNSSMVSSYYNKKKNHAMMITKSVKEPEKNNNLTKSRRHEHDRLSHDHARSLIAERNVLPKKQLEKEKAVLYPHNIYSLDGGGRVDGGYVYKSPKNSFTPENVQDIYQFSDFINATKESGRSAVDEILNKTTEFSNRAISLNPVRKFAKTHFIPRVKDTSENKLSKLGDLLKIPPKPEMKNMNILMNRNIYDHRTFNINQKRIIDSYPAVRKLN